MFTIELNKSEYDCFQRLFFPSNFDIEIILSGSNYILTVDEDHADDIRDICLDELQYAGLDANYDVTPEGLILESLVDKFFTC